jgi:hypothetical protein
MPNRRSLFLFSALALLGAGAPAAAQRPGAPPGKPQVLILGTYHMGGSGDLFTTEDDVRSPRRQRELDGLVEVLARFRPTKIAVEVPLERDSALNARYRRFLAGGDTLDRSETYQIGFRLAKRLGHARLYAVDYKLDEDVGKVMQWAAQNGDTAMLSMFRAFGARMQASNDSIRHLPLAEALRRRNTPAYDALHSGYLRLARVGRGSSYVGADVVAGRYERNLKIFANIARIAEPGDRVLVIYGASHGKLLRDFVRESGYLELVPILPYLGEGR